MSDAVHISVEEMRDAFKRAFELDREFWRSQTGLDQTLSELERAESLREIVRAVDPLLAAASPRRADPVDSDGEAKLGVWRSLYTRLMRSPTDHSPGIRPRFAHCWSGCRQR